MSGRFEGLSDSERKLSEYLFPPEPAKRSRGIAERSGMPLSCKTTPANADERAQVLPLPDPVHPGTGKVGRPRKRVKVLAGDKGYDSSELRRTLRKRGIRPQLPKRAAERENPAAP